MNRRLILFVLLLSLGLSACSGTNFKEQLADQPAVVDEENQPDTPDQPADDEFEDQPDTLDQTLFRQLSELFEVFSKDSSSLWTSDYRLDQDQALYVRTDAEGNPLHAYIFNYDDAGDLPSAQMVDTGFENLGDVYLLREIPNADHAESIPFFDFQYPVGDDSIFMMKYSDADEGMPVDGFDWQLYVAHEALHRYQILNWQEDQEFIPGDYPLNPDNIALVYLEHKLLIQALETGDQAVRETALKQFLAVRAKRIQLWPEVESIDNSQERMEGLARYLEYRYCEVSQRSSPRLLRVTEELTFLLQPIEGMIRDSLSFGRFYVTGAALGTLLDELGLDWKDRIEAGETPYDFLSSHFQVNDPDEMIKLAKEEYDFESLFREAEKTASMAETEPESNLGSGGEVEIEAIKKPYQPVDPSYAPEYLPEGYEILGMFSYSVDEIEFPPIKEIFSPENADITVVDLGNGTTEDSEIRISRSAYQGTLEQYFTSLTIGSPPTEDLEVNGYLARGFEISSSEGIYASLTLVTGDEVIILEGPIDLDEAARILESIPYQ